MIGSKFDLGPVVNEHAFTAMLRTQLQSEFEAEADSIADKAAADYRKARTRQDGDSDHFDD